MISLIHLVPTFQSNNLSPSTPSQPQLVLHLFKKTLSQSSSTGKKRQGSDSLDDNHTFKYQTIDYTSKMLEASANTENSFGIDPSSSNNNVDDLFISQNSFNHLMNPASSIDLPLSIITQYNQLNRDSEILHDDSDYPFNTPIHPDPPISNNANVESTTSGPRIPTNSSDSSSSPIIINTTQHQTQIPITNFLTVTSAVFVL